MPFQPLNSVAIYWYGQVLASIAVCMSRSECFEYPLDIIQVLNSKV